MFISSSCDEFRQQVGGKEVRLPGAIQPPSCEATLRPHHAGVVDEESQARFTATEKIMDLVGEGLHRVEVEKFEVDYPRLASVVLGEEL
mmetsp:Transcript_14023/g.30463  ORF Transcript_14023/g.30463 Transcript_14023/m.30463 type:complete len:89 (+) Transcript_14023:654-920(+)